MTRVDLLPDSYLAARGRARRARTWAAGGAAFLLLAGAWAAVAAVQLHGLSSDVAAAERDLAGERARLSEFESTRKEHARLAALLEKAGRLELPLPATAVVARLVRHLPDALMLERLSLAAAPPDLLPQSARPVASVAGQADPAAIKIELDGVALSDADVARLVNDLSHDKLFANVKLARSRYITVGGLPRFGFQVSLEVQVPAAPEPAAPAQNDPVRPPGDGRPNAI